MDYFKAGLFENSNYKYPLPYRLFMPEAYSQKETYPLVLYLHSGGARGDDNVSQIETGAIKLISDNVQAFQKAFILAPQCPKGQQWLNITFTETPFPNVRQDTIPESDAMKMAIALIMRLKKEFNLDSDRIYVTGPSMGGSGTWDIITRYPSFFAAAIPINGVSDPSKANLIDHLPIWAHHGRKDKVSDVNNTRNMVKAIESYGSNCMYSEYKNMGHSIASTVYNNFEIYKWLFKQKKK